jgi:OmpA-OmpF porin, OOP family
MRRVFIAVMLAAAATPAAAEPTYLGAFFGPRMFSDDSRLGYIEDAPFHPTLTNAVQIGARVGKPFGFWWLVPEVELAVSPTRTTEVGGAAAARVFWLEPRAQLRIELLPQRRVEPFLVVGAGAPVALSSARRTFNTGVTGSGYVGGGLRFDTTKGFAIRFDARAALMPGIERAVAVEIDVNFGVELALGAPRLRPGERIVTAALPDRDGDGIPDDVDACPDRPEDKDGFEDEDGCPDIDNDGDRVLDIADKCPTEPETWNGYMDDDGCPDSVPADVQAVRGTVEGLLYADGETAVRDSAQRNVKRIAQVMATHPSVKIILVGHTDDREAQSFAVPVEGEPAPDVETIAVDLSRARAESLRQALVAEGVPPGRIMIDGVGAEEPVADNASAKGRLANRRVELRLHVPR